MFNNEMMLYVHKFIMYLHTFFICVQIVFKQFNFCKSKNIKNITCFNVEIMFTPSLLHFTYVQL